MKSFFLLFSSFTTFLHLYAIWLLDPCSTTLTIKASFLQCRSHLHCMLLVVVWDFFIFQWLSNLDASLCYSLDIYVSNWSFFVSYGSVITYLMTFVLIFDHRDSSSRITDMTPDERREQQKQEEALHASSLRVPRRHVYSLSNAAVSGFINWVFLPEGLMYFTFLECKTH